ncbi:uncharacterized protein G2W53_020977 [Senna tora]|uniref:Uncharacterized protein n=1 Tax=Senna tora TaxID=362788 RepID=A0A834TIP8_9FABA|nr:uncharacterized protein G2W53_020977 [Senna tora]
MEMDGGRSLKNERKRFVWPVTGSIESDDYGEYSKD